MRLLIYKLTSQRQFISPKMAIQIFRVLLHTYQLCNSYYMLKVTDIVREIILSSETELTAMSRGVLNLSAYAKRIRSEVQRRARKPVEVGTIVVALSRFASTVKTEDPLLPPVVVNNIAVKSGLAELAFWNTKENKARAAALYTNKQLAQADFLTITYGIGEISIFLPEDLVATALRGFRGEKPKLHLENLASLTVRFGEHYIETPNMYFALLRHIAVRRINIVELVSTFTELTFLVHQNDLTDLFQTINGLMRNQSASFYTKQKPASSSRGR